MECKKSESENLFFPIRFLVFYASFFHLASDGGSPIRVARPSRKKQAGFTISNARAVWWFFHMRCLVRGASAVRRFGLDCHHLLLRRLCISMNRGEDNTWKLLHAFWGGVRADIVPGSQHEQQAKHFWCWLTHLHVHNCSTWTHTVHARACVAFTVRIPILTSQRSFHCPAPVRPSRRKYWATARIARYLMLARHQVIPNPTVQLQADYIGPGVRFTTRL